MSIWRSDGGQGYCLDTVTAGLLAVKLTETGRADTEITPGVGLRSITSGCLNLKANVPGPDSSEALKFPLLYKWLNGLLGFLPIRVVFFQFETDFAIFKYEAERCMFGLHGICQAIVR